MYSHSPTVFRTYRFDAFEVDTRSGELRQNGARIPLQDVPFRLLAALLERPGDVCSRDELRNEIWPAEVHLDFEGALATAARKVRQALGDSSHAPRFIETLPGRGFRFIGEVNVVPEEQGLPQTVHMVPSARRRFPVWTTAALLAGLAVTVLVVWNVRGRMAGAAKSAPIRSIAVLPLENLSANPDQEYFADGMTDAVTTELGRISGFDKVIAWQSMKGYKKTLKPLAAIARELDVDALVQGSVQREGTQIRIATKLFRTRQEKQLWAWSYDRDAREVLSLQREVAEVIAREVHRTVAASQANPGANQPTVNPEAYDLYLRGKNYYEFGSGKTKYYNSIQLLERSIALAPEFFQPYTVLARAHLELYWGRFDRHVSHREAALAAAQKALHLQPRSAEAHWVMGRVHQYGYLDQSRALKAFETARSLDPNDPNVHLGIGAAKRRLGMIHEAVPFLERAVSLNPKSGVCLFTLGETYSLMRKFDDGDRLLQQSLLFAPSNLYYPRRAWFALLAGRPDLAREILAEARELGQSGSPMVYYSYELDLWSGDFGKALESLSSVTEEMLNVSQGGDGRQIPKDLLMANALFLAGSNAEARFRYQQACRTLEEKIRIEPSEDHDLYFGPLGIAYAGLKRKQEALEAGRKAISLCPVSRDALRNESHRRDMARIYVMVGEPDEALKELDYLLSIPSEISTYALMNDPTWAPLKTSKGLQDLVRKYGH